MMRHNAILCETHTGLDGIQEMINNDVTPSLIKNSNFKLNIFKCFGTCVIIFELLFGVYLNYFNIECFSI